MKNVFPPHFSIALATLFVVFVATVSWQADKNAPAQNNRIATGNTRDTIPPKSADPHQTDIQLNFDSVLQQVSVALSKIDYQKMQSDAQKALADIDYTKLNQDIKTAMKKIDLSNLKLDVSSAIDSAKMSIDKIRWEDMKRDLEKAKAELNKTAALQKINTDSLQKHVQQALKNAQLQLREAQTELALQHDLPAALSEGGLLTLSEPYRVELKDGYLYINGKKQTKAITNKYASYYGGKTHFVVVKKREEAEL